MGQLDAANNIITHANSAPSNAYYYRVFNQYTFQTGQTGSVNMCTVTCFNRSSNNGPVTVTKVEVHYTKNTASSPFISEFFIEKKFGRKTNYLNIPSAHIVLKKSGSFSINLNETYVQSVQLYVYVDNVLAGSGNATRYQYITLFY